MNLRSSTDAEFVNALRAWLGLDPIRCDGRRAAVKARPKSARGSARTSIGPRGWNWSNRTVRRAS